MTKPISLLVRVSHDNYMATFERVDNQGMELSLTGVNLISENVCGTGGDIRKVRLRKDKLLSHHKISDHLSREFSDENCLLGAKLARLAAREPDIFDEFLGFDRPQAFDHELDERPAKDVLHMAH